MSSFWRRFGGPRKISDQAWTACLAAYPFLRRVGAGRLERLRAMTESFLASKQFAGEAGLRVDDAIGLAIAAQACLPVLELGLRWYDDFDQIIVYPDQFLVPRRNIDAAGVVHEETVWLAGETIDGGPVVLSWADAEPTASTDVFNVVIHEFVHKLDLRDGEADGVPPLPAARRREWIDTLDRAFERFNRMVDDVEDAIPPSVDPDSEEGQSFYRALPLDSYAAEDPAEFFAVAGEAFFLTPGRLRSAFPALSEQFEAFFGLRLTD
ncbi:MAG: zinc-dependent peptidase [Burkholderiaceae bacterium]